MTLHKSLLIVCSVVAALSGCSTPEQAAAERANYIAGLRNTCAGYGFTPGTDNFARCVQTVDQRQQAAWQAQAARTQCLLARNCPDLMPSITLVPRLPTVTNCGPNYATGGVTCTTQ